MTDKILLALVGAGLWANVAATWIRPAKADPEDTLAKLAQMERDEETKQMASDIRAIAQNTAQIARDVSMIKMVPPSPP